MKKHIIQSFVTALLFTLSMIVVPFTGHAADEPVIQNGIYASGISLGGMTESEAVDAINSFFEGIADSTFSIQCMDGETEQIRIRDWNLTWDAQTAASQAVAIGNSGFLINQYKQRMDLHHGNLYLDVPYEVDADSVRQSLRSYVTAHDSPATDAVIKRDGDGFVLESEGEDGTVTDEEATTQEILNTLAKGLSQDMAVSVITKEDKPSVTSDMLSVIKDELGSFTTEYKKSKDGRKQNIKVATGFLNGTVLMPGESLSVSTAIKPRTEKNGYAIAAQYSNGEQEEDIGGGVCQVSTTLYNALIRAELQIDKRYSHSMVVNYVDYGSDAAIATGLKDLVFTNNLENPIYIYGKANGTYLTFKIYGVETRPENRKIKFVSETLKKEFLEGVKEIQTKELKKGKTKTTTSAHPEVIATLTKIIYIDGEETERILLHKDHYRASQKTVMVGIG